jgi:hypothetical protein
VVRQRSRWLKGYGLTYATHMRRPGHIIADLGLWGFIGVQVLFLATLAQVALAPLLWTFLGPAVWGGPPHGRPLGMTSFWWASPCSQPPRSSQSP